MQARRAIEQAPEAGPPRESIGELLGQLANNSAALIRDELVLAKQEMREKLSALRSGLIVVAISAVIGLIALLALCAAAIIALAEVVGAWQSALIIGAALGIIGGATAWLGLRQIKRTSLRPEQTIETLEEDKAWLKELT